MQDGASGHTHSTIFFYIGVAKLDSHLVQVLVSCDRHREFQRLTVVEFYNSRTPSSGFSRAKLTQQAGLTGRAPESAAIFEISQKDREEAVARDRERSYRGYKRGLESQWAGQLLRHHYFHPLLRWKIWDDCDWGNPTFIQLANALVVAERLHLDLRSVDTDSVNWEKETGDEGLASRLLFCAWTPAAAQHSLRANPDLALADPVYSCVLGQNTGVYRDTLNDPRRVRGLTVSEHIDDSIARQQLSATPEAHQHLQDFRERLRSRNVVEARRAIVTAPPTPTKRRPQYDPETVDPEAQQAAKRQKAKRELELKLEHDNESDDSLDVAVHDAVVNDPTIHDLEDFPELK